MERPIFFGWRQKFGGDFAPNALVYMAIPFIDQVRLSLLLVKFSLRFEFALSVLLTAYISNHAFRISSHCDGRGTYVRDPCSPSAVSKPN